MTEEGCFPERFLDILKKCTVSHLLLCLIGQGYLERFAQCVTAKVFLPILLLLLGLTTLERSGMHVSLAQLENPAKYKPAWK